MEPTSINLTFFGSGPVAAGTLEGLKRAGFVIGLIITKPKPVTHKANMPVLDWAKQQGVPVLTPKSKQELTEMLVSIPPQSEIGLVVDYGIIIDRTIVYSFKHGIVNSHFSLLPEWRGADPITFSILSGQKETGVSLMLINERLDEGDLLAQEKITLDANITTPELTDRLVNLSNNMLAKYLPLYLGEKLKPYSQTVKGTSFSRKLSKQDAKLVLTKPAEILEREVRAFTGWPKSNLTLNGNVVIVTKSRVAKQETDGILVVRCGKNTFLEIQELIAPSGKKMCGADFLRGYDL